MREKKQKRAIGVRSCDSAVYRDMRTSARANKQHTIMRLPHRRRFLKQKPPQSGGFCDM